jgi:plastocyanin
MNSSRGIRFGAFVVSVLAFSLAVAGVAHAASTATVYATDAAGWHPTSVSLDPGGTVTWQNRDTKNPHTVQCDQSGSNSPCPWSGAPNMDKAPTIGSNWHTASVSFPNAGTFAYYCSIHPNMTGTVVVGSGHPPVSSSPSSAPRRTSSAQPTTRASVAPTKSASVAPSASKSKAAPKPGQTTRASTSVAPSVLAAGPTAAKKTGVNAGAAVPAALLIAFVGGAHIARARRRTA